MNVLHLVGARPNFMKVAPVMAALSRRGGVAQTLVHTGQHYDVNMSEIFFAQLVLPKPDLNLEVGSGSHAEQTAMIMTRLETVIGDAKPDLVLVYGDVNSTLAAALVCAKLFVPTGHVEAGLRQRAADINRRLVKERLDDSEVMPRVEAFYRNVLRTDRGPGLVPLTHDWVGNSL